MNYRVIKKPIPVVEKRKLSFEVPKNLEKPPSANKQRRLAFLEKQYFHPIKVEHIKPKSPPKQEE